MSSGFGSSFFFRSLFFLKTEFLAINNRSNIKNRLELLCELSCRSASEPLRDATGLFATRKKMTSAIKNTAC